MGLSLGKAGYSLLTNEAGDQRLQRFGVNYRNRGSRWFLNQNTKQEKDKQPC